MAPEQGSFGTKPETPEQALARMQREQAAKNPGVKYGWEIRDDREGGKEIVKEKPSGEVVVTPVPKAGEDRK